MALVGQHLAGNIAMIPSDVIDFAMLPAHRLLAGNSFYIYYKILKTISGLKTLKIQAFGCLNYSLRRVKM